MSTNPIHSRASYLRQTILLSQYDAPEARALFKSLKNVEGKILSATRWDGLSVPDGVDQVNTSKLSFSTIFYDLLIIIPIEIYQVRGHNPARRSR